MSSAPTDQVPEPESREPESPPPKPSDDMPPLSAAHKRSRMKKVLTPVVLAVLGLVLLVTAFILYPSTPEAPSPPYSRLWLTTTFPTSYIIYKVFQVSLGTAEIRILVQLPPGATGPPVGAPAGHVSVSPPFGIYFRDCPAPACTVYSHSYSEWTVPLAFRTNGAASVRFFVEAHNFGLTYNGVTASAAIPEVIYQGPVKTQVYLLAGYPIPSAPSYDWSSFPTAATNHSNALWQEALINGDTAGRTAVGLNHAGQSGVDNETFFAGALLGLAGGAILAAVQEALHPGD
jgi:hypothetical protein